MKLEVEAVYENGVLKLDHPVPLAENQRVKIVIQEEQSGIEQVFGIIGWKGDAEVVERIAMDPEFGIAESP